MKRTFKFFMMAAIVAAGFTACSSEEVTPPNPDDGNGVEAPGVATYATFTFDVANSNTRAPAAASSMQTGFYGDNADFIVNSIRLLIFNATNQLEANVLQTVTAANPMRSATVKVMSGNKKILVLVNEKTPTTNAFTTANFVSLDPDNPAITTPALYSAVMAAVNLFEVGQTTGVPADSLDFVGGNGPIVFNIANVTGPSSAGTPPNPDYPYIMSNPDDNASYYLVGGVSLTESQNNIGDAYNHFTIDVKRAVAKVILCYESATTLATLDGLGTINGTSLRYGLDNVNRSVYLFQQFDGAKVKAPYYDIPTWAIDGLRQHFYPYFYKMYNIDVAIPLSASVGVTTPASFVTENTMQNEMNGNLTYAAIEGVFTPNTGKWVSSIGFDASLKQVTVNPGAAWTGTTLYSVLAHNAALTYTNANKFEDLYLYNHADTAYKALYLLIYGTLNGATAPVYIYGPNPADINPPVADWTPVWRPTQARFLNLVDTYTDLKCYYRMEIGAGTFKKDGSGNFTYQVLRNSQYFATITGFETIGVNDRRKLDNDPYKPKSQPTHVTATISVLPWDAKTASGTI